MDIRIEKTRQSIINAFIELRSHKELLEKKGYYYQLVRQQFADEESRKVLS